MDTYFPNLAYRVSNMHIASRILDCIVHETARLPISLTHGDPNWKISPQTRSNNSLEALNWYSRSYRPIRMDTTRAYQLPQVRSILNRLLYILLVLTRSVSTSAALIAAPPTAAPTTELAAPQSNQTYIAPVQQLVPKQALLRRC